MAVKIKLGSKAGVFHDPSIGLTIHPGEVVEISEAKASSPRIKIALNGGHIVVATAEVEVKEEAIDVEAIKAKFLEMVEAKKEPKKIAKAFNINQVKALAKAYEIEPEEGDTKDDLVNAILEDLVPAEE